MEAMSPGWPMRPSGVCAMAAFSKSDPKRSVIDGVNSDLRCHPLCHEVLHLWVDHAIKLPTIQLRKVNSTTSLTYCTYPFILDLIPENTAEYRGDLWLRDSQLKDASGKPGFQCEQG
jgi:hypothetical protein